MSASAANINLVGNIGQPPEFKHKEGQTPFCVFTLAVNRVRRRGDTEDPKPVWYAITLWGQQAETAVRYGHKGQQVYVQGRQDVSEWVDRENRNRFTLEVAATDFQMLGESVFAESERLERDAIQQESRT